MFGHLDILSSTFLLLLKGTNASVVLLFDFISLLKQYCYHCYYDNRNIMNVNQSLYKHKYYEDACIYIYIMY